MGLLVPARAKGEEQWWAHRLVAQRAKLVAAWLGFGLGTPSAFAIIHLLHLNFAKDGRPLFAFAIWIATGSALFSWFRPSIERAAFRKFGSFPPPPTKTELEARRARRADSTKWMISAVIWGFGAYLLIELWYWTGTIRGALGDLLGFVILVVANFYFFALALIHDWLKHMLGD
jgi:hypothetical protein